MNNEDHRVLSTPFATGGGGFHYEDHVAAYILAAMLCGAPPFGPDLGEITSVAWQTAGDGWHFDDLLVRRSVAGSHRIAISCKTGRTVTSRGWPADIVRSIWEHWDPAGPFSPDRDILALVTPRIGTAVRRAWLTLLAEVLTPHDSKSLRRRYTSPRLSSATARALFRSLSPQGDSAPESGEDVVERAIGCLRLWELDLLSPDSPALERAIEWCERAGAPDRNLAVRLHRDLLRMAASLRPRAGALTRTELVKRLTKDHAYLHLLLVPVIPFTVFSTVDTVDEPPSGRAVADDPTLASTPDMPLNPSSLLHRLPTIESSIFSRALNSGLDHLRQAGWSGNSPLALRHGDGRTMTLLAEPRWSVRRLTLTAISTDFTDAVFRYHCEAVGGIGRLQFVEVQAHESLAGDIEGSLSTIVTNIRASYGRLRHHFLVIYRTAAAQLYDRLTYLLRQRFAEAGLDPVGDRLLLTITHAGSMAFRYHLDYESMSHFLELYEQGQHPMYGPLELALCLALDCAPHTINELYRDYTPGVFLHLPTSSFRSFETDNRFFLAESLAIGDDALSEFTVGQVAGFVVQVGVPQTMESTAGPILKSVREPLLELFRRELSHFHAALEAQLASPIQLAPAAIQVPK
jgi:hypothetical protein